MPRHETASAIIAALWWENGVFPLPHRTAFKRANTRRCTIFACSIFFPHTLFHTRTLFLAILLFSILSLQHLSQSLFILKLLDCNSNSSRSLCSHVPNAPHLKNATSAAFISCKCVNSVISPQRHETASAVIAAPQDGVGYCRRAIIAAP